MADLKTILSAYSPLFLAIPSRDYSGIGHPSSNHVRELPTLNIHLASPAAAIALGLMYLRTGDKWIRGMLAVKDTFYEIDKNRPDMLMIRTLCQCLVDFDNIRPTKEWVDEQVPEIAQKYTKLYLAAKCKEDMWWADVIDVETVAKAYFYCLTGACFAVALRHASTCDQQALRLIHNLYEILEETAANPAPASSSANPSSDHSWAGLASWAGRNCVKACINVYAMSLGLIMAGSGDLQTTRLLRKIRNILPDNTAIPPKDSSVYSQNISVNMALGLLYLGYGRYCLSNSNLAIAALVISLFPLFPHSIADNRFYFQPIRFLWILAVKKNPRPNKLVRKVSLQQPTAQQEENVGCQRCGRTEITNDHKFIFD